MILKCKGFWKTQSKLDRSAGLNANSSDYTNIGYIIYYLVCILVGIWIGLKNFFRSRKSRCPMFDSSYQALLKNMNKTLWFSLSVLRVNKWIKAERECVFWYLFSINPNFRIFYSCPNTKIRANQKFIFQQKKTKKRKINLLKII